jgi:cell division protein ZapA
MTEEHGAPISYVTVEVYDQVYHLSGQDEEHIRALAARVDAKMRAVAAQGRTADSLRVAVLAALNLADEVSQLERADSALAEQADSNSASDQRIDARFGHARAVTLRSLLDEVLEDERKTGS